MTDARAHEGCVWLCRYCGKKSPNRYPGPESDKGYDESCMLNAVHVAEEPVDGMWKIVHHPDDYNGAKMMEPEPVQVTTEEEG